jgi:hypothetical protein
VGLPNFAFLPGRGRLHRYTSHSWRGWTEETEAQKQKTHQPGERLAVGAWATTLNFVTFYRPQKTHTRHMYNTYRRRRASGKKSSSKRL